MPHKDPERAREAAKNRKARQRARERANGLAGTPLPTTGEESPLADRGKPPTLRDWAHEKVEIGRRLCAAGLKAFAQMEAAADPPKRKDAIPITVPLIGCRDATAMVRLGVELVNANLELLQPDEREQDKTAPVDAKLMTDPEFRDLMERALIRKAELIAKPSSA